MDGAPLRGLALQAAGSLGGTLSNLLSHSSRRVIRRAFVNVVRPPDQAPVAFLSAASPLGTGLSTTVVSFRPESSPCGRYCPYLAVQATVLTF